MDSSSSQHLKGIAVPALTLMDVPTAHSALPPVLKPWLPIRVRALGSGFVALVGLSEPPDFAKQQTYHYYQSASRNRDTVWTSIFAFSDNQSVMEHVGCDEITDWILGKVKHWERLPREVGDLQEKQGPQRTRMPDAREQPVCLTLEKLFHTNSSMGKYDPQNIPKVSETCGDLLSKGFTGQLKDACGGILSWDTLY
ncbi:hypothetical protein WISP_94900 [Willisornis vidua]|uniref:Uncharacterized protein n=1 Tax=Willisornis vidua TaxID=1566151 RepID=A0ABQ9D1D1_9PASS|nr:hypothetical protein WISP_94900 [Willisornis vidua]